MSLEPFGGDDADIFMRALMVIVLLVGMVSAAVYLRVSELPPAELRGSVR